MDFSFGELDVIDREQYRNPPAPLGYQNANPPDIVRREILDEFDIDFNEWRASGIFDVSDVTVYDKFIVNSDSEDDEITEVPVEPIVRNIEEINLSDEEDLPVPLGNIKKEREEKKTEDSRVDSNRAKEVKTPEQRSEKQPLAKEGEKRKEVKVAEQKVKKPQDKAGEDTMGATESREKSSDRYRDKKKREDEREYKKRLKSENDRESRRRRSRRDDDTDTEEERHRRKEKKYLSLSPDERREKKHRSPSPSIRKEKKYRSPSPDERKEKKYRSPSPAIRKEKKYRSPSPDDYYKEEYDRDFKLKEEYDDGYFPSHIKEEYPVAGSFHCDVCNLTLNSYVTYESHMTGKRHKKNVDARNVAQAVAKSFVPPKPTSKCPNPPVGFKRVRSNSLAKIQHVVDDKLRIPCPGLQKVIEIQTLHETSYYCTLCDAPCSANSILPHLSGFKHQLNCLKYFDPRLYEEIGYKQKYQIEKTVTKTLMAAEDKYGRGHIRVEKDVPDDGTYDDRGGVPLSLNVPDPIFKSAGTSSGPSSSARDQPSTSRQDTDFVEKFQSSSMPDPSKAGFYCNICLSHSNSQAMWDAHINGKRHIANLKKAPGTAPSKSRNVPAPPGTRARLDSYLRDVIEPIVGLNQIREIQRLDFESVSYTCFLCGGISVCEGEIIDHLLLTKHREKYLEKIRYPELETLRNCQMSDHALSSVIAEMCERVEAEEGRGVPEVYYAKNSIPHG